MTCSLGHIVPDGMMTCPICLSLRYEAGIQDYQREFLRKAKSGLISLRVTRDYAKHLVLYGDDSKTFCGQTIGVDPYNGKRKKMKFNYVMYGNEALDHVCLSCRIAISQAFEEVAQ